METTFLQKATAAVIVIVFFMGRYAWSLISEKRKRIAVGDKLLSGRFLISVVVYLLLPALLVANPFDILVNIQISTNPQGTYYLGLILSVFGSVFMFLARLHRQKDWGLMGDAAGDKLFTRRIYGVTRHPYYVGSVLIGCGVYLILNSWLVMVMVPVVLFVGLVIKREDTFLAEKFGEEWITYKNKVGIIPWL